MSQGREDTVAVVTGGAVGIGAAIAEELGRQGAFVVTVDPGVAVDGTPQRGDDAERTTAERIVDAGGRARASNTSVTDAGAVHALFAELVDEFGRLDTVVNVAGISRPSGFVSGGEDEWWPVLSVHLDGYLNVLRAALPIMAAAGRGRILGVTSGSGWRAADAGAYSCAKRAVAALTWRLGQATPPGVSVNALSPLAATRMVLGALSRQAGAGNRSGSDAATGGVQLLAAVPPPEHLGPVGAYLAGEDFADWCRGQIMYSNGAELTWVAPPQLLEAARTADVASITGLVAAVVPAVLAPAEAVQASQGGGNLRVAAAFDDSADPGTVAPARGGRCAVVTDDAAWRATLVDALSARGIEAVTAAEKPPTDFAGAAAELDGVAGASGALDAVVLALTGDAPVTPPAPGAPAWERVLDQHAGITERILTDAAWVRAVADHAAANDRALRVVTVVDAASAGGRSRAQAATQLSRAAHPATADRVDAYAISVETADPGARGPVAELVAHLVDDVDAGALSGAELVATSEWFGLRSHPRPAGTITFGGPSVPDWIDGALRALVHGNAAESPHEEG